MNLFTGCVAAAGLMLASAAAQAQLLAPYEIGSPSAIRVSDFNGPYADMPPEAPPPPRYGRVPSLLPPMEVYTVLRENGYLPLGAPRQHGFVYTISVIDHGGEDGRLVIDARDGHIIRFVPAYRMGDNFDDEPTAVYASPPGLMPRPIQARVPRPPAPIPHVANRVPVPKRSPLATTRPAEAPAPSQAAAPQPAPTQPAPAQAATPEPAQQAAAAGPKQAEIQSAPQAPPQAEPPTVGKAATPAPAAPAILPTQEMPKVQGLE
ncbi:hypothetical protein JQ615_00345 [Bradyrhizobium jicamae]|uniref:Uncharacterized protein n=1 Tax=Bradyrhizobium jicamae TaxID=280332 RepID=A0ABS5FBV3_9BRAD|nr:hypothetical protein [Bradyrhizobium jicamae]MBR0793831.1 hypothetical protein [Bradyrhizobium jicamae]MBR0933397.1 hypothetical protein [Bradyrhizobium jicamae]